MVVEITATITAAFLCFWVAEEVGEVSGVLAVVVLAMFMAAIGKYAVSPDVNVRMLHVMRCVLHLDLMLFAAHWFTNATACVVTTLLQGHVRAPCVLGMACSGM